MSLAARLLLVSVALVALAEWRIGTAPPPGEFRFGVYVLSNLVVSLDLLDLLVRSYFRRVHTVPTRRLRAAPASIPLEVGEFTPYQVRLHLRPWALLLSVHNLGAEVDELLAGLAPYREHLWIIDDASTDDTADRLERAGVRLVRGSPNRLKPGALHDLLAHLPPEVVTVLVLDPDARIIDRRDGEISELERVLFEFQRSRMAALCPHIGVRKDGWLARFQMFEYDVAFSLGRKSMADHSVTSGVAVYRRDALEKVFASHTLSVYAEDLRNAILLLASGEQIYYDGRLYVETDGKRTLSGWFSQRVGWFYGLMKVYSEHLPDLLRLGRRPIFVYQFVVYLGVLTIVLHPLKVLALGLLAASAANGLDNALGLGLVPDNRWTEPWYFLLAYAKYLVVALAALTLSYRPGQRLRTLPVIPAYFFYALAQIVPITVGYLNWISLRLAGRRLYRDHYQDEDRLREEESARRKLA